MARTCDKFNGSTRSNVRSPRLAMKSDATGRASVRVVYPLSWPHNLLYQCAHTRVNDKPVTLTPPTQHTPEGYLVGHEIIVLHLAVTVGGAESYPFCTRIRMGLAHSTVSFPSAYNDNDPRISNITGVPGTPYTPPFRFCPHRKGHVSNPFFRMFLLLSPPFLPPTGSETRCCRGQNRLSFAIIEFLNVLIFVLGILQLFRFIGRMDALMSINEVIVKPSQDCTSTTSMLRGEHRRNLGEIFPIISVGPRETWRK